MFGEDFIYYIVIGIAFATPLLWLISFALLKKMKRGKIIFWFGFVLYFFVIIIFYFIVNQAGGWDRFAYYFMGSFLVTAYSVLFILLSLLLRKILSEKK